MQKTAPEESTMQEIVNGNALPEYTGAPWLTIAAACEVLNYGCEHESWTEWGLRNMLRNPEKYGLDDCHKRLGNRILVSPSRIAQRIAEL
jgi:hypothetical protein